MERNEPYTKHTFASHNFTMIMTNGSINANQNESISYILYQTILCKWNQLLKGRIRRTGKINSPFSLCSCMRHKQMLGNMDTFLLNCLTRTKQVTWTSQYRKTWLRGEVTRASRHENFGRRHREWEWHITTKEND